MAKIKTGAVQPGLLPGIETKEPAKVAPKARRIGVFHSVEIQGQGEEATVGVQPPILVAPEGSSVPVSVIESQVDWSPKAVAWQQEIEDKGELVTTLRALQTVARDLYGCPTLGEYVHRGWKVKTLADEAHVSLRTVARCVRLEGLSEGLLGAVQQKRIAPGLALRLALRDDVTQAIAEQWLESHDRLTGENLKELLSTHSAKIVRKLDLSMQAPAKVTKRTARNPEDELEEAHAYLDRLGTARASSDGTVYSLKERIVEHVVALREARR